MKKFLGGVGVGRRKGKKKVNIFLRAQLPPLPTLQVLDEVLLKRQCKSRMKCGHNKVFAAVIHLVLLSALQSLLD